MFPIKGSTVWVNFKGKPCLGKILQTSPELDMVCVRISNYLDNVSRESKNLQFAAHSCPEPNYTFSSRQSSVVITCGFADICLIESSKAPNFLKTSFDSENENMENDSSDDVIESNSLNTPLETSNDKLNTEIYLRTCSKTIDTRGKDSNWSESFGINKLLRTTETDLNKNIYLKDKLWKCSHCNIYSSNENNMCTHVINAHKLETFTDKDNWVIIGGIKGLDYDEIKFQEDTNIKSLNDIHISTNSPRKRQILESVTGRCNGLSTSTVPQNHSCFNYPYNGLKLDPSITYSDLGCNLNEMQHNDIQWSRFTEIINEANTDFENVNESSNLDFNTLYPDKLNSIVNDQKMQTFQSIFLQHQFNSNFSIAIKNTFGNEQWPNRFRSNSIPDQFISDNYQKHSPHLTESLDNEYISRIPSKKSRLDSSIKKCRKIYGIDHRHLWCNQCKWKKACSRFSNEFNIN